MTTADDDAATVESRQEEADFNAGFERKPEEPTPEAKPETAAPEGATDTVVAPVDEFVQVKADEWRNVLAAAAKTGNLEHQITRLNGSLGNMQKRINEQTAAAEATAAARAAKVELPEDSFAALATDYPELAVHIQAGVQKALTGLRPNTVEDAEAKLQQLIAERDAAIAAREAARELEVLQDAYPDWKTIVGATASGEAPDPNNAFRKWLATKEAPYQERINATTSAAVLGRAIRVFRRDTAPPAAKRQDEARAERIKAAVQPRGDGAHAAVGGKSAEDEFEAGFLRR